METLHVNASNGGYNINIGNNAWERAAEIPGRKIVVCDSNTGRLYGERVKSLFSPMDVITIPAGEQSKTPETLLNICRRAAEIRADRKCTFVALGGGVVGDITGFAAAIYLRGVKVIQLPTSLLSMVDSSVGGKTAVDIPEGKNLIGAFHPPCQVAVNPQVLATLPARELGNGLAEVVKTAMLGDAALFEELENSAKEITAQPLPVDFYTRVVLRCCRVKAEVVAADERESGCRAMLNYGHTFGHALELLSNFELPHGEGVALGMIVAAELALKLGIIDRETVLRQRHLLEALNLPTRIPETDTKMWLNAMTGDKKACNGKIVLVLPEAPGRVGIYDDIPEKEIAAILNEVTR